MCLAPTAKGKIEIYSTGLAENFPEDKTRPVVPHWIEESEDLKERLSCDRAEQYPFLVEIKTCKVKGPDGYMYEPVWLNPIDAGKLGIADGDVVSVYNIGGAIVTERTMPGTVYQDHGARIDAIVRGKGGLDRGGANNLICPLATASENTLSEATNGFLVNVKKVDVVALAEEYPEEFKREYDPADGLRISSWLVG